MLAWWSATIQDIPVAESYPASQDDLQRFYDRLKHVLEGDGTEAQRTVRDWSTELFRDARSEAEVLMLMHGQGASDRYLYGLCAVVLAIREENGGTLPELTEEQYELDREVQDSGQAAQDSVAADYFSSLEETFVKQFPLSATLMAVIENDLRSRLRVSEIDIEEGFIPGWYKGMKATVPLFMDSET